MSIFPALKSRNTDKRLLINLPQSNIRLSVKLKYRSTVIILAVKNGNFNLQKNKAILRLYKLRKSILKINLYLSKKIMKNSKKLLNP